MVFLDSADPAANEVAGTASGLLMPLGIMNAAQGPASPATAVLRAFMDTRAPMGHYLVGLVGLPVGCIAALPLGYETEGVWFGLDAEMITTAVLGRCSTGSRSAFAQSSTWTRTVYR